jgi:hypothetical protein
MTPNARPRNVNLSPTFDPSGIWYLVSVRSIVAPPQERNTGDGVGSSDGLEHIRLVDDVRGPHVKQHLSDERDPDTSTGPYVPCVRAALEHHLDEARKQLRKR